MIIRKIDLVSDNDSGYRNFKNSIILAKAKPGPRQHASSLNRLSRIFERAIRAKLGTIFEVSQNRILTHEKYLDESDKRILYNELDAVITRDGIPEWFVEIKFSSSKSSIILQAEYQLSHTVAIARRRWPSIRPLVVCVFLAPEIMMTRFDGFNYIQGVEQIAEATNDSRTPCIIYDGTDVWAMANELNVSHDTALWISAQDEILEKSTGAVAQPAPQKRKPCTFILDDGPDENPFAAFFRAVPVIS